MKPNGKREITVPFLKAVHGKWRIDQALGAEPLDLK